jgi:dihydroorotate dehydrogenase electron transfer subunit
VLQRGSAGRRGFVTGLLEKSGFEYYYACGPLPMLNAVHRLCEARGIPGQLSYEEKMGCGFGVCMGCSCHTRAGARRVCTDGPVFFSQEVMPR